MAAANNFGIGVLGFLQSCKMSFGNDQYVRRSLGLDIFEREYMRVFVNFFRWNFSADNAAEKAVGIVHGCFTSRNDNTEVERLSAGRVRSWPVSIQISLV